MGNGAKNFKSHKIAIVCFATSWVDPWDQDSYRSFLSGSEESVLNICRVLTSQNHQVSVFANPPDHSIWSQEGSNPKYYKVDDFFNPIINKSLKFDLVIMWRRFDFNRIAPHLTDRIYLWLHDIPKAEKKTITLDARFKGTFFLSDFHQELYKKKYPELFDYPFVISGNGINKDHFPLEPQQRAIKKKPYRFAYISNWGRGLEILIYLWPRIYSHNKKAELYIYYGDQTYGLLTSERLNRLKWGIENLKDMGVTLVGAVGHERLAEDLTHEISSVLYPNPTLTETFCISIVKAMYAGCFIVSSLQGAVKEILCPGNYSVPHFNDLKYVDDFADLVIKMLDQLENKNDSFIQEQRLKNIEWAQKYTWEQVVQKWATLF